MKSICVAGIHINFEPFDNLFFEKRLTEYLCDATTTPDMVMKVSVVENIDVLQENIVWERNGIFITSNGDKFCRYIKSKNSNKIGYAIHYTFDYSDVYIELRSDFNYQGLSTTDWEYLFTGFMFANRISFLEGTVLHSSSIAYKNNGILFSADSGTGKSTHTALWKKHFGDDVVTINDDKPAIRFIDSNPYLFGTPWSGKTAMNSNIMVPLKCIVFLERGIQNEIREISIVDSIQNFIRQLPNPYYDRSIGERTIKFIEKLYSSNVPIYALACNISDEAVMTVYNKIFKEQMK